MARQLVIELVGKADKFTKSLDDAEKSSKSFGDKVEGAGKKMSAFVSVPILGFLGAATKAAADDAAAQDHLALTLKNVGENAPIGAIENYISSAMKSSTFTDDELRPSFEALVRVTGEAEKAMDLQAIAMDVATGKGIDLETASNAVAKASEGNFAAVNKLVPGLLDLSDKTLTAESATAKLAAMFNGQAQAATETTAGKMKNFSRDMGEVSEKIGGALLPALGSLAGFLTNTLLPGIDKVSGGQGAMVLMGVALAGPVMSAVVNLKNAVLGLNGALTMLADHPVVLFLASLALALKDIRDRFKEVQHEGAGVSNLLKGIPGSGLSLIIGGAQKLAGRAAGGPVAAGTPYVVGEHGPELFVPGQAGMIMPNNGRGPAPTPTGAGGGGTQVIQVALDGRVIAEVVRDQLLRKQRTTPLGFAS